MNASQRPALVHVEMTSPNGIPKLRVNKYRCFLEIMAAWYKDLSRKERKHLTTKRFKRRALLELERLQYEYNSLPQDWVSVLLEKYGVKLNEKRKRSRPESPDSREQSPEYHQEQALRPMSGESGATNNNNQPGRSKDGISQGQPNSPPVVPQAFPDYTHKLMQRGGLDRLRPSPTPPSPDHITLSWLLDRPKRECRPVKVYSQLMMQQPQISLIRMNSAGPLETDKFNKVGEASVQAEPENN